MWLKTGPGLSFFSSPLHFNAPESFPFLDVKLFFSAFLYFAVSCEGFVPDLPAPVGPSPGDAEEKPAGTKVKPGATTPRGHSPAFP